MELDAYLKALLRWWYIPVALLILTIGGVWMYHNITGKKKAEATVAVMQPYVPAPGEFSIPQIGFDALYESGELSRRVAARLDDGTKPQDLKLSIDIVSNLNRPNPSLLYGVSAASRNGDRAINVANIAVAEATKLFNELNTPNGKDIRAALQPETGAAEQDVTDARAALTDFEQKNDAYDLDQRLNQELSLVGQLRMSVIGNQAGRGGSAAPSDAPSLSAARRELKRLLSLKPEYDRLSFQADLAKSDVGRLETRVSDLSLAGSAAAAALADAQAQLDEARNRLSNARTALAQFESANGVSDLSSALQTQQNLVSQLVIAEASSDAGSSGFGAALATEQTELQRLESLKPQRDKLNLEVQKAEGRLAELEQRITDTIASRTIPSQAQVKVLHDAAIQSNLWWLMITYGLGVILALFVSLSAVYLLGYFRPAPYSIAEFEKEFARPVMAHVPRLNG